MNSFVWAVIAMCAAGGAIALLAVAAAATQRSRRRAELAEVTASGGTQIPETRIEVVAISDADPDHHGDTIERE